MDRQSSFVHLCPLRPSSRCYRNGWRLFNFQNLRTRAGKMLARPVRMIYH
jgi:hypothetical protein